MLPRGSRGACWPDRRFMKRYFARAEIAVERLLGRSAFAAFLQFHPAFLPDSVAAGLNLLVGLLIVFFGLRMLMRRSDS